MKIADGVEDRLRHGADNGPAAVDEPAEIDGVLKPDLEPLQGLILFGPDKQPVVRGDVVRDGLRLQSHGYQLVPFLPDDYLMRQFVGGDRGRDKVLILQSGPRHLAGADVLFLRRCLVEFPVNQGGRADKPHEAFFPFVNPEVRAQVEDTRSRNAAALETKIHQVSAV